MKNNSFYQWVLREISKSNFSRMNITAFTRLIRSKVLKVPTSQLMYLYCELERLNPNRPQFHPSNTHSNHSESFRHSSSKPMINYESYEKQALICLEEIALKLKEKNGFEECVDLCRLFYMRLINVIEYHLPYLHVLEQFREEFIWKDVGEEVIDYVALIEKNPSNFCPLFVQTVNLIVQQVSEELQNIDILQLPYLKSVLSKGRKYDVYNISDQLLQRVDSIIAENKFAFSFGELQKSLGSENKNRDILEYYALISKDLAQKRLNYLYIDSLNDRLWDSEDIKLKNIKKQIGLPGKTISEDFADQPLKKMSDLQFYGAYINIFGNFLKDKQLKTISLARQYIQYHFNYFFKSGNLNCNINEVSEILVNTLKNQSNLKENEIRLHHVPLLRLFFVLEMLLRNRISGSQLSESHSCLKNSLEIVNSIQKLKVQNIEKIFEKSSKFFTANPNLSYLIHLFLSLKNFLKISKEHVLLDLIHEELDGLDSSKKTFIMNELIICLISTINNDQLKELNQIAIKLLEIFMRSQFKKFSIEALNIEKILLLAKELPESVIGKNDPKSQTQKKLNPTKNSSFNEFYKENAIESAENTQTLKSFLV